MFCFSSRKPKLELQPFMLRLINRCGAGRATVCEDRRLETRTKINLGVLLIPMCGECPEVDAAFTVVTKDISSTGLAVMTDRPLSAEEVLIRLPGDAGMRLVRATVRNCQQLGCGWIVYNFSVVELLDEKKFPDILRFDELAPTA
jgi:hypothetical protein